jgi:hypothetical protein
LTLRADPSFPLETLVGDFMEFLPLIPLIAGVFLEVDFGLMLDDPPPKVLALPNGDEVSLFLLYLIGLVLVKAGLKDLLVGEVEAVFLDVTPIDETPMLPLLDGDVAEVIFANLCPATF